MLYNKTPVRYVALFFFVSPFPSLLSLRALSNFVFVFRSSLLFVLLFPSSFDFCSLAVLIVGRYLCEKTPFHEGARALCLRPIRYFGESGSTVDFLSANSPPLLVPDRRIPCRVVNVFVKIVSSLSYSKFESSQFCVSLDIMNLCKLK